MDESRSKTETQSGWTTETWNGCKYIITVCDKCSELLKHRTNKPHGISTEIRVEACPECSQAGLKLSEEQLDLVLRMARHAKPKASVSMVFSLADYDGMIEIEHKILELSAHNSAVGVAGS